MGSHDNKETGRQNLFSRYGKNQDWKLLKPKTELPSF